MPAVSVLQKNLNLPMAAMASATVETTATTVKSAATVDRATAMEAAAAVESAATANSATGKAPSGKTASSEAATRITTTGKATSCESATTPAPTNAGAPAFTTPAEAAAVEAVSESVEPRTCADEYAAHEPIRSIVAVRRAGIGSIVVVAVGANRCRAVIPRTDSDAHCNLGVRLCDRENRKYCQ
jgi:hypothetical protein